MDVNEKADVRDEIKGWLKDNQRSLGWLSKQTGFHYHTLYSIIKLKTVKISEKKLDVINAALDTNFEKQ